MLMCVNLRVRAICASARAAAVAAQCQAAGWGAELLDAGYPPHVTFTAAGARINALWLSTRASKSSKKSDAMSQRCWLVSLQVLATRISKAFAKSLNEQ